MAMTPEVNGKRICSTTTKASTMHSPAKHYFWLFARTFLGFALAAALLFLTLRRSGARLSDIVVGASSLLLIGATLSYATTLLIATLRWQWLLRVQGVELTFGELIRLTLIGAFFNLAIPGAVGGDLVKIGYLRKLAGRKNTEAIVSVAMDRFLGLLGLLLVALVSIVLSLPFLLRLPAGTESQVIQIGAFVVGIGSFTGVVAVILFRYQQALLQHHWIQVVVNWGAPKLPMQLRQLINRLQGALAVYGQAQRWLWGCVSLSLVVHSLHAATVVLIGRALPGDKIAVVHAFVATQIANAVSSIPLTPAGIGTRDATLGFYLSTMGLSPEKSGSVPLILSMIILVWALVGAVIFIIYGRSKVITPSPEVLS